MSEPIRLQKILAERGIASRRGAEKLILEGAVSVNGKIITELGTKADAKDDIIEVNKKSIQKREESKVVVVLHKPIGFVTSTKRTAVEKDIVLDLLPKKYQHLFPVGRLDKDSSGLLLMTNDGDLAFQLTHPKFLHTKTYHVLLANAVSQEVLDDIRNGAIKVLGQGVRPATVRKLGGSRVEIILTEGKNRHIRRLFRSIGTGVKKLRRVGVGKLHLDDLGLQEGMYRELNKAEISRLKAN